ncbi:MAG: twin-arginine translocase TatA/TatE family subunit [bacterium]
MNLRNFGLSEVLVVVVVLILLFGAKRLPDLARSIGKSLNEFKKGREEGATPDDQADDKPADKKS